MIFKKPSRKELISSCEDIGPDDGVDPRTPPRDFSRRAPKRKALQLCSQVARTLNDVFAWECGDDLLRDLTVQSVQPAPNSGRLLVTIALPPTTANASIDEVLQHLHHAQGLLRSEVAAAIHRRRVPLLTFRIIVPENE